MSTTTVLVTGASRGIGKGLAAQYLARDNHTVIATVRDTTDSKAKSLSELPTGKGSKLIIIALDAGSQASYIKAISSLTSSSHSIQSIDIAIANAGVANSMNPALKATEAEFQEHISINSLGPLWLYQEIQPLLLKSSNAKFIAITSMVGSIHHMNGQDHPLTLPVYGGSKALLNMILRTISATEPEIITFPVHPGWVQTDMGNRGAEYVGMQEAPVTLQDSVDGISKLIDEATKETSGKFLGYDGAEIPW